MHRPLRVGASLLTAPFDNLAQCIARFEPLGIDEWHLDIMDGHFVPAIALGPQVVQAVRSLTTKTVDVHLMVYDPFRHIETFVAAGAHTITIHCEATEDIEQTLNFLQKVGVGRGLALNPDTPPEMVFRWLPLCDRILVMTVPPGKGGQNFMEQQLPVISALRDAIDQMPAAQQPLLQVDGGLNAKSAPKAIAAGAEIIVSGNYLIGSDSPERAVAALKGEMV